MALILRFIEENHASEEQIKEIYIRALSRASREPIETIVTTSSLFIEVYLVYKDGWGHFVFSIKKDGDYKIEHECETLGKYSL